MTLSHSLQLLQTVKNINDTPISMQMAVPHIHVLHETVPVVDMRNCKDKVASYIRCEMLFFVTAWFSFQYCAQLQIYEILNKMQKHCFDI